jgi:hypothetical protein
MTSVALDLFNMPTVVWEGATYDMIAVCVDRHSGWIVAIPCKNKGLTGAKVAKGMLTHQWRPFGIPSIITSDQGSHFASQWFNTMCATLGIRQGFSQAYHHQANGRAEMAGQQILEKLRKMLVGGNFCWVELLPAALDRIHDTPGESGLSPYQIVFGRDRPLANKPYEPPRECEDAQQFFEKMKRIDKQVADKLNEIHKKEVDKVNLTREELTPFKVGDLIYYRRPEKSGSKLDSRWIGPAVVRAREGERSYVIEIKEGVEMKAHRSFMKPCFNDNCLGQAVPLFYHKRTILDPEAQADEWIVDKILKHRKKDGQWEFLTKWQGFDTESATWQKLGNFFHRLNSDLIEYAQKNNLNLNITHELDPKAQREKEHQE